MPRHCELCLKSYKSRQSFYRHNKQLHSKEEIIRRPSNIKCGLCHDASLNSQIDLCCHISAIHLIDASVQTLEFSSRTDVELWRSHVELEGKFNFCTARGVKRTKFSEVEYLHCNRSGSPVVPPACLTSNRNRRTKMDFQCTTFATITTFLSGVIKVTFCLTHYGHDQAVSVRPRLPAIMRYEVANIIKQGWNIESSLQKINSDNPDDDESISAVNVTIVRKNTENLMAATCSRTSPPAPPPSPCAYEEIVDDTYLREQDTFLCQKEFIEQGTQIWCDLQKEGSKNVSTANFIIDKMQEIKNMTICSNNVDARFCNACCNSDQSQTEVSLFDDVGQASVISLQLN